MSDLSRIGEIACEECKAKNLENYLGWGRDVVSAIEKGGTLAGQRSNARQDNIARF
jgi:hypothetical protein